MRLRTLTDHTMAQIKCGSELNLSSKRELTCREPPVIKPYTWPSGILVCSGTMANFVQSKAVVIAHKTNVDSLLHTEDFPLAHYYWCSEAKPYALPVHIYLCPMRLYLDPLLTPPKLGASGHRHVNSSPSTPMATAA